jgi:tetratricopeptide (TPR) repeat protein
MKFKSYVKQNPNNPTGYLELGIISMELKNYSMAKKLLTKAYKFNKKNGKTLYYLGQLFEKLDQKKSALRIYNQYDLVSFTSPFRRQMSIRYETLNREIIRSEMQQLLAQEQNLNITNIPPKSVAVFPFTYQGKDDSFAALGIGIGEMMITDLSQVNGMIVIERIRLQTMFNEISMGQSGMVEEGTAPRFGKLLGAAKIVHGNFDVSDKKNVEFNVGFWDVKDNYFPDLSNKKDVLKNLFKMEKDLVFSLLNEMNISLTVQERMKIQEIPTKNLQAFLTYCMGLQMENNGNFGQAAKFFQQAKQIDPDFKKASQKIETSQSLVTATQTGEFDFSSGTSTPSTAIAATTTDLVNSRLTNISSSIGTIFVPGQDNRESAQEASHSGVEVLGDLPLPPAPPIRR